jgi:hypothetical protein
MALALIGNLASKLLPAAVNWGMSKLSNTNIAQGVGNKINILKKWFSDPALRPIIKSLAK